jgi:hypothetical protein
LPGTQVSCAEEDIFKKQDLSMQYNWNYVLLINYYLNTGSQEVRISTNIVGYAMHLLINLQYKVKAFCVYAVCQQLVYDVAINK